MTIFKHKRKLYADQFVQSHQNQFGILLFDKNAQCLVQTLQMAYNDSVWLLYLSVIKAKGFDVKISWFRNSQ